MSFIDAWPDNEVELLVAALKSREVEVVKRAVLASLRDVEDAAVYELVSPETLATTRDFLAGKVAGTRHATMAFERCERACQGALNRRSGSR